MVTVVVIIVYQPFVDALDFYQFDFQQNMPTPKITTGK